MSPFALLPVVGGKRDGTVPARRRRPTDGAAADNVSFADWSKSGKVSLLGDSGMVSRSGVEWPLLVVGGPHICGLMPSWA